MKINIAIIRLSWSRIWEEIWNIYEIGKAVKYTWLKKKKKKKREREKENRMCFKSTKASLKIYYRVNSTKTIIKAYYSQGYFI